MLFSRAARIDELSAYRCGMKKVSFHILASHVDIDMAIYAHHDIIKYADIRHSPRPPRAQNAALCDDYALASGHIFTLISPYILTRSIAYRVRAWRRAGIRIRSQDVYRLLDSAEVMLFIH